MKKNKYLKIFAILCCLLCTILFTYFYVYNESPIYIFDYSGYFENFKMMGKLLFTNFKLFCETLIVSIRTYDYNYSSVIPLMPFFRILGESRISYILSLVIMYVFPSILLITKSFNNIIKEENENDKKENSIYYIFTLMIAFMYTRLWSPTLRGLTDIIGIVPISLSFIMIKKRPLLNQQSIFYPILLGLVVYLPFLFRRWYVYYIISFCVTSFLIDLFIFVTKRREKKIFLTAFKNYLLFGSTILLLALLVQFPLLKSILSQSYSDAYNGFQVSLSSHFINFYNEFGFVVILLSLAGIILSIFRKKYIKYAAFCTLNVIVFWVTFGSVQGMGVHHYLGVSFWMIILTFLGIRHIYELTPKYRYLFLALILVLFAINFSTTFIFRNKSIPLISQGNKYYKFRYYNFNELEKLISDAEYLVKDPDGLAENSKISVLADSEVISDNLLDLLGNVDIKDNIIYATHIDSRDGINFNSLIGKYVIVTPETQVGTNPDGQYVIDIPNRMIYDGYGIGKAYKKIKGPYLLDNGVEAYIYEKTRSFTDEEVREYFYSFYEKYPQWEQKYTYFDKILLSSDIYIGSNCGAFKRMDENTYFFYPGVDSTKVSLPVAKKIKSLKLKFYVDYKGSELDAGKVEVIIQGNKKKLFEGEITSLEEKTINLDLDTIKTLTFTISGGQSLQDDWLMMDILDIETN